MCNSNAKPMTGTGKPGPTPIIGGQLPMQGSAAPKPGWAIQGLNTAQPTYSGSFGQPKAVPQQTMAAPQQTGVGPFGNPLYGSAGWNAYGNQGYDRPAGYAGALPQNTNAAATTPATPATTAATTAANAAVATAAKPVPTQAQKDAFIAAHTPQIRTGIVSGGKDVYRDALATELKKDNPYKLNRRGREAGI